MAYVAVAGGPITSDYIARFVTTWQEYPPGSDTDLVVISNGGPLSTEQSVLFSSLDAKMFIRSNDGWDIGGFVDAARGPCKDYDSVLWVGESNYFHREGWLKRLAESYAKYGPGFYGPYSSNAVRGHLNTTAFFCPPLLVRQYPIKVVTRADRYGFEHGENALWRRVHAQGKPCRLVTFDGEWEPRMWRYPQNILWRGDQTNLLMFCNHSDNFDHVDAKTKAVWARRADAPCR